MSKLIQHKYIISKKNPVSNIWIRAVFLRNFNVIYIKNIIIIYIQNKFFFLYSSTGTEQMDTTLFSIKPFVTFVGKEIKVAS